MGPFTTIRPDHYEDSAAARLAAQANYAPGETVGERDSGDIHLRTTSGWTQIRIGGTALVTTSPAGQMRIREEDALDTTRKSFTFSSPGISAVKITAAAEALAVAGTAIDAVAVCFDAPTDAIADAWLTAGDSNTTDSQRYIVKANGEPQDFVFTSPITRIDIKRDIGANALRVVAVGVEV